LEFLFRILFIESIAETYTKMRHIYFTILLFIKIPLPPFAYFCINIGNKLILIHIVRFFTNNCLFYHEKGFIFYDLLQKFFLMTF